jgi:hypothetical protein
MPEAARDGAVGMRARATVADLAWLQRSVGNRAVVRALGVHRKAPGVLDAPGTLTWESTESSRDRARLSRTTKVEVSRRGEVGPEQPRVRYDRRVDVRTSDGINAYVSITVTVYLNPSASLPATLDEALRTVGRAARGGWSFSADGGRLVPAVDSQFYERDSATSLRSLSTNFPGFAWLSLTPKEQEAAVLRHIATLKRRPRGEPSDRIRWAVDLVTDFVPGVSNLKDFLTFLTGVNPTGEKGNTVGPIGRLLALVLAIPALGVLLKYGGRGAKFVGRYVLLPLVRAATAPGRALVRWVARSRWGAAAIRLAERALGKLRGLKEGMLRRLGVPNAADKLLANGRQVRGRFPATAGPDEVLYRTHPTTGKVTYYQVYGPDGLPLKRVDISPTSAVHGGVPPPHVVDYQRHTNPRGQVFASTDRRARPAASDEIPRTR